MVKDAITRHIEKTHSEKIRIAIGRPVGLRSRDERGAVIAVDSRDGESVLTLSR
jgi:hypothetical protein